MIVGAEVAAPAAGTIMATTPALANILNGNLIVAAKLASDDSLLDFELAIRNAANDADISVMLISASEAPGMIAFWFQAINGQFAVARAKGSGTTAKNYQVGLNIWRY